MASLVARLWQASRAGDSIRFSRSGSGVYGFLLPGGLGGTRVVRLEMARSRFLEVDVTEGAIRVRQGGRMLTITPTPPPPAAGDAPDFIIHLDDIETWDAPDNEVEIEVAELQMILRAVEEECDRHGLSVEFE